MSKALKHGRGHRIYPIRSLHSHGAVFTMKSRIMAALSCLMGKPTVYGLDMRRIETFGLPARLFHCRIRCKREGERVYVTAANEPVIP